jgi:hypothetical protein
MTIKIRFLKLIILAGLISGFSCAQVNLSSCIYQPEDRQFVAEKLKTFASKSNLPIADLMTEIGLSFIGTPYAAATLENGPEEKLVINIREMDCTTFVETSLALARTVKSGKKDFESYAAELELIRYRNGTRNQYLSRLHYFAEWIHDNAKKGIVDESPNFQGQKVTKRINFMSTHPESYPVLKEHPELIPTLANQENKLSGADFWYFPKADTIKLLKALKHGDIIGLASDIDKSIDINHTGIIVQEGTIFYLLHASQTWKKVVLSEDPITDFIKPESKNSGIVIARPLN